MSTSNPIPAVYTICQAHLDPIWCWDWDEGLTETLATFEVAADLIDEYPEFIFNHNESVLYLWTQQYKPELFARIKEHVRNGRWVISGGWFLQPDANLPHGESFARQILIGKKFFREELGVEPKVAYNFDSFGHHGNMPQFLKQSGYDAYVHFRPVPWELKMDDYIHRWRGVDGTEIPAMRPPCVWYCTHPHDPVEGKIERMVELAKERNRAVTAFWGAGNHGGGATRADLDSIRKMMEKFPEVRHGSIEWFAQNAILPNMDDKPVTQGELQKCFTGCYTSIIGIKQRNRRGEGLALAAERYAALAWWLLGESYPAEKLSGVWRDVLFNQFHDILPGSCIREGARSSAEIMGRAFTNAREVMLKAQLALIQSQQKKRPLTARFLNPHPVRRCVPTLIDVQLATHPAFIEGKHLALFDAQDRPVARQLVNFKRNTADWRVSMLIETDLPAMGLAEYRIEVQEKTPVKIAKFHDNPDGFLQNTGRVLDDRTCTVSNHTPWCETSSNAISIDADTYQARLCRETGRLISLVDKKTGEEMIAAASGRLVVRADINDAWGGTQPAYGPAAGVFDVPDPETLAEITGQYGEQDPAPPVRIIASGPLMTVVEVLTVYKRSVARLRYSFYRHFPYVDVDLLLNWNERRRAVQFELNTAIAGGNYAVEIPHASVERPRGRGEEPCGRWTMLFNDSSAFTLINDGPGGVETRGGMIRQTLVRSAVYAFGGELPEPGFVGEHMDLGEHAYRFKLAFGPVAAVQNELPFLADDLMLPQSYLFSLPLNGVAEPGLTQGEDIVKLESDGLVKLEAMKQSDDGKALIVRVVEKGGKAAKATLHLPLAGEVKLSFTPFQMKTLRFEKVNGKVTQTETNLLER